MKIYSSIIDAILDDKVDYDAAGLKDAKHSGDELKKRTHSQADKESHVSTVAVMGVPEDWRNLGAKAVSGDDVLGDVALSINESTQAGDISKRQLSDAEVKGRIKTLLNEGATPISIAASLDKLAEINLFNKGLATDYLKSHAGLLGLAYIEPNAYMNKCPDTYERLKVKAAGGRIAAKAVKQISACAGCELRDSRTCNLYHLPIVANEKELAPIINKVTAGVPKTQKLAALVSIANREDQRVANETISCSTLSRVTQKVVEKIASSAAVAPPTFTVASVEKAFSAGYAMSAIFKSAALKVGSSVAGAAVRKFVEGLKNTNTKIALKQLDCTLLKRKLSASNAILGEAKCGSCGYRNGMHCGFTGGTLLSFPDMDKIISTHKTAATAIKDGSQIVAEYDLINRQVMPDVASNEDRPEIQMDTQPRVGTL